MAIILTPEQFKKKYGENAVALFSSTPITPKKQTYGQETMGDIKETGSALKKTYEKTAQKIDTISQMEKSGEQNRITGFAKKFGATLGGISQGIGDVLVGAGKAILPQKAEEGIKSGVEKTIPVLAKIDEALGSPVGSRIEAYKNLSPKDRATVDAFLGAGSLALDVTGLGVGGKAVKGIAKTGQEIAEQTGKNIVTTANKLTTKGGEMLDPALETGKKIAGDIIPTKEGLISGNITKALDLTQGDVSNLNLASGLDIGEWVTKNSLIGGNKAETVKKIKDFAKVQYDSVRNEISKVPTVYTTRTTPRVKEALTVLKESLTDVFGQEKVLEEVINLLKQKNFNLTTVQRVKELIDDQYSLYKATGAVKEGQIKAGLANVRRDIKKFIEDEVKKTTGAEISIINKDVAIGNSLTKLAEKRATRGLTRAEISLSDLGVFGGGSMIGTPLFGAAALIAKRIAQSSTMRLQFAKFLKSLPTKKVEEIKSQLLKGIVPEEIKKLDVQDLEAPKPNANSIKNSSKAASPIE